MSKKFNNNCFSVDVGISNCLLSTSNEIQKIAESITKEEVTKVVEELFSTNKV